MFHETYFGRGGVPYENHFTNLSFKSLKMNLSGGFPDHFLTKTSLTDLTDTGFCERTYCSKIVSLQDKVLINDIDEIDEIEEIEESFKNVKSMNSPENIQEEQLIFGSAQEASGVNCETGVSKSDMGDLWMKELGNDPADSIPAFVPSVKNGLLVSCKSAFALNYPMALSK